MNQFDTSTPQPGILHRCFFGATGIRAGWRLLIFLILVITFVVATTVIACILFPALRSHSVTPLLIITQEGLPFLCLLLASLIMARIEGRKVGDYGLPWRRMFCRQFWLGTMIGFVSLSLLISFMQACGTISFHYGTTHGTDIWVFGSSYALAFLVVALLEEFFVFGYTLFTLFTGMGFWKAAILLSTLFASLHLDNPGETWLGIMNTGLTGILSCLILRRTGNLWLAVGYHAAWDWAESYFYGVANSGRMIEGHFLNSSISGPSWLSGGSVGPEGSVLCTIMLVTLWLLINKLFPKAKFPPVLDVPESPNTALDSPTATLEVLTGDQPHF